MSPFVIRRAVAVAIVVAAVVVIAVVVSGSGSSGYTITADMKDVSGLRNGANVRLAGAPVGRIEKIDLLTSGIVHVKLKLDSGAAPVGRDAKVVIQSDDLFGERYLELTRGDLGDELPKGGTIPLAQTGTAVRLDDVVDSLDMSTRVALESFLREQGTSVVGRGRDLAATLTALPASLQDTGVMLSQLGQDTQAIGRLIDESDRVIGSVAHERPALGRLVGSANDALQRLASRRDQLGSTVRTAPQTLASAQSTLAELQAAAKPLAPAADGLRTTAPLLTQTLKQIPGFAKQAIPTLKTAEDASPALSKLGRQGAPIAKRLKPLAAELLAYSKDLGPALETLDAAAPGQFGLMEGWARATQSIDGGGHLFRFGETAGSDLESAALALVPKLPKKTAAPAAETPKSDDAPKQAGGGGAKVPKVPDVPLPHVPAVPLPGGKSVDPNPVVQQTVDAVTGALKHLTGGK